MNQFFTLCAPNGITPENRNETYACCLNTCTTQSSAPHLCYSMCAQVFPMMKDRCAFEAECWRDGFYNKKCLDANADRIHQCCVKRCQDFPSTPYPYDRLDCERYCSDYNLR